MRTPPVSQRRPSVSFGLLTNQSPGLPEKYPSTLKIVQADSSAYSEHLASFESAIRFGDDLETQRLVEFACGISPFLSEGISEGAAS